MLSAIWEVMKLAGNDDLESCTDERIVARCIRGVKRQHSGPLTCSLTGIEIFAKPVADEIKREDCKSDCDSRKD